MPVPTLSAEKENRSKTLDSEIMSDRLLQLQSNYLLRSAQSSGRLRTSPNMNINYVTVYSTEASLQFKIRNLIYTEQITVG